MKILHLLYESKGDYFGIGGVGIRAYEIYKNLKSRHDITLLCKKYPGAKDKEIEGLKHIFVGTESKSLTNTLLSYAFKAGRFVKKLGKDFDIVIEEFSPAIPTFLHLFTQKPLVLQVQGYTGMLYFRKYNPLYAMVLGTFERLRPTFYDNLIFVSPETLQKFFFGKGKNTVIIPNGIKTDLLDLTPDESKYILYFGRIDIYGKGLDTLIHAYREFHQSFPGIHLMIAGDGRNMEKLRTGIMKLPDEIRQNIEIAGWVSDDNKKEVIRKALFAVFPSRHEVQPISVLEVMACGIAVLVSNIPELSFVWQKKAGVSFRTGDSSSLAQSMKTLLLSNERNEMGQRGREYVQDLTWDRIALRFEKFLLDVYERSCSKK